MQSKDYGRKLMQSLQKWYNKSSKKLRFEVISVAKNSLESRIIEQSDMILQLNKMIVSLQQTIETFNTRESTLLQEIQTLKEQNNYLTKKLFGKSSEKSHWEVEGQLFLFNELEQEQDVSLLEEEREKTATVTKTVRKKRATDKERYAGLPVIKKYLDIPEEERFCPFIGKF